MCSYHTYMWWVKLWKPVNWSGSWIFLWLSLPFISNQSESLADLNLRSFLKAPCHPIFAGSGLMLIKSSFEYSYSELPCDHPPHCCQFDCSEMEIWSFLYNSLVSLTSQSLVWSKMLVGSIFKNSCDLVPASFSGACLVCLQNLSVPALLNTLSSFKGFMSFHCSASCIFYCHCLEYITSAWSWKVEFMYLFLFVFFLKFIIKKNTLPLEKP